MQRWFVVESLPNSENKAWLNLKDQGFTVFHPVCWRTTRHARKTATRQSSYFPRYMFALFDARDPKWQARNDKGVGVGWSVIKSTRGVLRLLTDVNHIPLPISTDFVEALQRRQAKDGGIIKLNADEQARFRKGDKVRVTDGPFTSFLALVEHMDPDSDRCRVEVELFGRPTLVDMAEAQLSAA